MEQKTNEKKVLVLSFLGVITLIIVVVGATYAYFTAQGGGSANTNVNVQTSTTDNLSFQVGAAISLTANQEDFGQGTGNKSGSTYARAILTANNTTNTATRNYYVYLNILNNNFEYTTEDEQGEILLKVTDPDGTEVTSIPGLTRKTSGTGENEVTGFDITTKTGSITIADNYEITASPSATQEWQIEVIFVNLDSDQNANTNKTFNANLIVREDSPIGITNVSTSNITSDSITLTVDAESENAITNYYFAKNEEEYVESDSNTYTFSGLDAGTEYTLKVYVVDEEGYQSAVYSTEESTTELTLAELCAIPSNSNLLSCAVYNQYTEDGANGIYLHDGVGTYTNADQEAGDNSYRYAGGDYQLTSTAMNAGYTSITTGVSSATNGIINFYCNGIKQDAYRNCNSSYTKYYTTAYDEKIQHTTIENALEQAVIDGYLTNSNIKNYVCFGSDEATCPNDNLYRIIGVFGNRVKLIKYDYVSSDLLGTNGDYYGKYDNMGEFGNNYKGNKELSTISTYFWNSVANYNEWSESQLNIVNLNQNYVNSIRGKWSDLIATTNWQVGGITKDQSNTPRSVYIYEIEGPIENVIYSAKIGLMYVSDYGYAASPENWNTNMESLDNNTNYNNWMFMGLYEWTISRCSDNMDSAFYVHDRGSVIRTPVDSHVSGIRPAFYLNSDVELASGIGTQIDPYRLSV